MSSTKPTKASKSRPESPFDMPWNISGPGQGGSPVPSPGIVSTHQRRRLQHVKTMVPVTQNEFLHGSGGALYDSEDDEDEDWGSVRCAEILHEYTDVRQIEKDFMVRWNSFVGAHTQRQCRDHEPLGHDLADVCQRFAAENRSLLQTSNAFRGVFALHLCFLADMNHLAVAKIAEILATVPVLETQS